MFSSKKKITQTTICVTHDCHLFLNLFHCWIILAKQLNKSGENTAHQRSRILQTKDIYYLPFSSLKLLWLLLEIRKPLQLQMAFQLLHLAHHWAEQTGYAKDISQATQGVALPCQLWFLAITFPQQVEVRSQNSGRLRRSRCAYLPVNGPRWAPWRCSKQAKRCNDSLQTLETDFFMNYLIETKETFSAPTSATNKTVPLKWINKYVNQWKSPPPRRKHARKKQKPKKQRDILCSDLLGHFLEADFKERVETRIEIRKSHSGCCFIWQLKR